MRNRVRGTEVFFKIALLLFFGVLYLTAIPYPVKSKEFPQLIALFSMGILAASLVTDITGKTQAPKEIGQSDDTELRPTGQGNRDERRKRFYQTWGIILLSTAAAFLGGFLFTAFLLLAGSSAILGKRANLVRNMAVAVMMTIFIYFSFHWFMGVPLLGGILW